MHGAMDRCMGRQRKKEESKRSQVSLIWYIPEHQHLEGGDSLRSAVVRNAVPCKLYVAGRAYVQGGGCG